MASSAVDALSDAEVMALYFDWSGTWARPSQQIPQGEWLTWLLLAGRGFGKTRVGAEWIRHGADNGYKRMALIGATTSDVRNTMVEGESGIMAVCPPDNYPKYEPSKRRVVWPNGAMATCFTADEPDRLRGPQHDRAWCDELAAWRHPRRAYDMLLLGLRLGRDPRCVITTTPKPVTLLREMIADPQVVVTRGGTRENLGNLAPAFRQRILYRYEGTTLGRQELDAELLEEAPGALWTAAAIEAHRVKAAPELSQLLVAVDPSTTATDESDECGIILGGLGRDDHHIYVIDDRSRRCGPNEWASIAVNLARDAQADGIVYESNQGGDLVRSVLKTQGATVPIKSVFASRGKRARAEPVAALYEQGRVHHVGGLPDLEDQLRNWIPGSEDSPDRLDALVWLVSKMIPLMEGGGSLDLDFGEMKRARP